MAYTFTEEQKIAITNDSHNLLVSASAGSGKTTVMIERIIHLLQKYRTTKTPLSISDFLVVTFTKASASDMKQKLIKKLSELPQDQFVLNQIEKVSTSDISNLHSFCSRLVSAYFYEIGVDPAVHIIDDTEASFLKNKALERLFETKQKMGDSDFFELYDMFQKKRSDEPLKNLLKTFDDNIRENIDGEKWFFDALSKCYEPDLSKNMAAKTINGYVASRVSEIRKEIDLYLVESREAGIDKLSDYWIDLSSMIGAVNSHNSYIVNAKNVYDIKIKTAPKLDDDLSWYSARAKNFSEAIKKEFDNFRSNFVSNDAAQLDFCLRRTKEIALKLYNLYKDFEAIYKKLKQEANGVDFGDLQHYALKILSNDEIRESVRKKYRYVLVDEYQDINAVQEKIISLVSSKKNRFMVGDLKQSIYRFRFCDPDIFLNKFATYEKGGDENMLIKLNANFRSDKKILKFVDHIFSGVMTKEFGEYDYKENALFKPDEKNLDNQNAVNLCFINVAKNEEKPQKAQGIYSVKNHNQDEKIEQTKAEAEGVLVANKIKEIMQSRNDVSYEDFAVLVASRNENVNKFVETLKSYAIPVAADKKYDLMKMPHIQEIVNFIKLSINRNDDFILFRVLKSRFFNFSDNELAAIRLNNKSDRFFEVFYNFDEQNNNCNDEKILNLCDKVSKFKKVLQKFEKLAKLMQVKEFAKHIVDEFDLMLINMADENGKQNCNNIETFLSALPNVDVFDFVNLYSGFSLNYENECSGNAVKVMTIHKSKGIEFKFVFLINLSNEINLKSLYQTVLFNKNYGVGTDCFDIEKRIQSSSIPISAIRLVEKRKLVEEQQRVLYVAMTRAVEKLFVICSANQDKLLDKFPSRPTAFIDWFSVTIKAELDKKHLDFINFEKYEASDLLNIKKKQQQSLIFNENQKGEDVDWFVYDYDKLKNIPLKNSISKIISATSDDNYENNYFSEDAVSSAERGTLYHSIFQNIDLMNLENIDSQLDKIFANLSESENQLVDKNKIKQTLKLEIFSEIDKQDIIFKEREFYARVPAAIIDKDAGDGEFIMQGVIDLLIIHSDEVWVIDYKTGKINDEKLKKYQFQLETYANICEKALNKKVTRKILIFIDEQKNIEF